MRRTDFWSRLEQVFGAGYAASVARDQVLSQLGGRTIVEALDAGESTRNVWRAGGAAYPDRGPPPLRRAPPTGFRSHRRAPHPP